MADPNVTSVVIDGREHWGSPEAKWARNADQPTPQPAPKEPAQPATVEETDAPSDAAPSKDPKPRSSRP